jgi:hypothetical protein
MTLPEMFPEYVSWHSLTEADCIAAMDSVASTYGKQANCYPIALRANTPGPAGSGAPFGNYFISPTLAEAMLCRGATPACYFTTDGHSWTNISSGGMDTYLNTLGEAILNYAAAVGHYFNDPRVIFRINQEMNLPGMPWYDSNPQHAIDGWRYIYDFLSNWNGVDLTVYVAFFYSPWINAGGPNSTVSAYYPGDDYVDFVGGDAYAWAADDRADTLWYLFADGINEIRTVTNKPFIIGETGIAQIAKSGHTNFTGAQRRDWMDGDGFTLGGAPNGSNPPLGNGFNGLKHAGDSGNGAWARPGWNVVGAHYFDVDLFDPAFRSPQNGSPGPGPSWRIGPQTTAWSGVLAVSTGQYYSNAPASIC